MGRGGRRLSLLRTIDPNHVACIQQQSYTGLGTTRTHELAAHSVLGTHRADIRARVLALDYPNTVSTVDLRSSYHTPSQQQLGQLSQTV
jgi:hypothetical protein